jgi:signal transduction histidine kinase
VPHLLLSPRQRLNLGRILREAASNALRHAAAKAIEFGVFLEHGRLRIALRHRGAVGEPARWQEGTGLATMRRRAADLSGAIAWRLEPAAEGDAVLCLELSVPLPAPEAA